MTGPDRAPAVVVAGDAFVDLTSTTTADGGPAYAPHPGGSCLNVAVGLGRLGCGSVGGLDGAHPQLVPAL